MHYQIFDIEEFKGLLAFWVDAQNLYYPIFYQFTENQNEDDDSAFDVTYWLSTSAYTVCINVGAKDIAEVRSHLVFGSKITKEHAFIFADVLKFD